MLLQWDRVYANDDCRVQSDDLDVQEVYPYGAMRKVAVVPKILTSFVHKQEPDTEDEVTCVPD